MAKKAKEERNGENVEGEEPNFDDPEDFVDDISDEGLCMKIFSSNEINLLKSSSFNNSFLYLKKCKFDSVAQVFAKFVVL